MSHYNIYLRCFQLYCCSCLTPLPDKDQGRVARSLVSTNRWLRGIKIYRFSWYLMLVSTNHASSNQGQEYSIYSYFEKGCEKRYTQQSWRVLWVILSSLFFKENWKNDTGGHRGIVANAKRKQQWKIQQLQCQEQGIDHIPYYLCRLSRVHFCDNLSRIAVNIVISEKWFL